MTEPSEWRVQALVDGWAAFTGATVQIRSDHRFFASRANMGSSWKAISRRATNGTMTGRTVRDFRQVLFHPRGGGHNCGLGLFLAHDRAGKSTLKNCIFVCRLSFVV